MEWGLGPTVVDSGARMGEAETDGDEKRGGKEGSREKWEDCLYITETVTFDLASTRTFPQSILTCLTDREGPRSVR